MLRSFHLYTAEIIALLIGLAHAQAGVVVRQGFAAGATAWPGAPLISTMANPASTATVGESFNGGGGNTNLSQTFTITGGNAMLQAISLYAGGGTGTPNILLKLFDLGVQTAPNPNPYTGSIGGANLLGGGAGLTVTCTNQANGIIEFDFTGADQLALAGGHMYAFELTSVPNSIPLNWYRAISDTYSGGAAYRNQSWINGTARDFALAVYQATVFESNYPPVPYGIVQHIFVRPVNGVNPDGANPAGGMILHEGVLCGSTMNGGLQGKGTAYFLDPSLTEFNLMKTFGAVPEANNPVGQFATMNGRLFGISLAGGTNDAGAVLVGQTNGNFSVLRSFARPSADNATNAGGASPCGGLTIAGDSLFGAASAGGAFANGTLFRLNTNGAGFTVLHEFQNLDSAAGTNGDGALPAGTLLLAHGMLYGTAVAGGLGGSGVIFSVSTNGGSFTVLHHFTATDSVGATNLDGAMPEGSLLLASNCLYGTTSAGGLNGRGTIFSIQTNGSGFAVLHHFSLLDPARGTNDDGANPHSGLVMRRNVLYGNAPAGGAGASGVVFGINADGTGFTTLHSFGATNPSNGTNEDGAVPAGELLVLANDLYGVTAVGGPGAAGTVFKLSIPAAAPAISSIQADALGTVTLHFLTDPGTTNVVQAAASLQNPIHWQDVSTNIAGPSGSIDFTDTSPSTNSNRFYRVYVR